MARAAFYLLCGTSFYDAVYFHDELFFSPVCFAKAKKKKLQFVIYVHEDLITKPTAEQRSVFIVV
jgi:hypothetical protein